MTSSSVTVSDRVRLASTLSVVVACVLVVAKLVIWRASGSASILASMADSGLDLLASLVTFFAVRYAATPPDKEHPFGHGKAEAFSALFQAGLVFASGALIMQSCVSSFLHPEPVRQSGWAIAVLVLSIVVTVILVMVQNAALKASGSVAIAADRMHYLTDLVSNAMALLGVGAAMLGWPQGDAIAGFAMALWFVWGAVRVLGEAADQLMDKSLDDSHLESIHDLVLADPRILDVHALRTRVAGPYISMQMHIEVERTMSLEDAHGIIIDAENRLIEVFPNADIIIHADPRGAAEPHGGVFREGTA